jgi:hypothetical protein
LAADNRAEQAENREKSQPCFAKRSTRAIVNAFRHAHPIARLSMLRIVKPLMLRRPEARTRVFNALCPAMTNAGLRAAC